MAIVNYYTGKRADVNYLYDLVGGHDGVLNGATKPTVNANGYLNFVGGNGLTKGDRSRVELTTADFLKSWNSTFTFCCIFRSSKADAQQHRVLIISDYDGAGAPYIAIRYTDTELLEFKMQMTNTTQRKYTSESGYCTGKWNAMFGTYSTNNLNVYIQGKPITLSLNETISSGNFYSANAKATLGCLYNSSTNNYSLDFTGDIANLINFNHKLSVSEIKNYECQFRGLLCN